MKIKNNSETIRIKVSKVEAKQRLKDQIDKGKSLLIEQYSPQLDLQQYRDEFDTWDEFNKALIGRLFTGDEEQISYDAGIYGAWSEGVDVEIDAHNRDINTKFRKLNSLIQRIDLMDELNPAYLSEENPNFWPLLHPRLVDITKPRYDSRHYADSVEAALKEVNRRVKVFYRAEKGEDKDGASLMKAAFSVNAPTIALDADLCSENGRSIQQGYMELFSGAMTGVRNPKAHDNISITADRCVHFLFLASLLMGKLDEAGVP